MTTTYNLDYWIKRKTSSVVPTVNVIELVDGKIISIRSFVESDQGNKAAERHFRRLHKEHNDPDGTTGVSRPSREYLDSLIEDGIYDDECGYNLVIVHS